MATSGRTPVLGPLTKVGGLRRAAEEFRRISPDLPTGPANAGAVPPRRAIAAERECERGVALAASGRLGAAIAAFTRAARLDPRNAAVHHRLGRALLDGGRPAQAAESLRLATALRDDAAAYCDLALALRRERLDADAVAAYRRAVALAPSLVEALVGLADLLELGGDYEEAAQLWRRAAALAPDTAAACVYLARALMTEGDFTAAETELRAAAMLDPENDLVHKLLGDVLVRQGRFEEAVATFDHVLALNPRQVSAYFAMAEAGKCTEADRPRLAHVLGALGNAALDDEDRLLLHFAAGKMLDDLGEYQTAMAHFDAANAIRDRSAKFDATAFAADVDRLLRRFTGDFYTANPAFAEDDETPLLIVGMPRSGTTLVEQILSRHPQIGGGGEQPFWIRRATAHGTLEATYLQPDSGRALAREYLSVLRRIAPSAARVTDKLPFNVLCVGLIHMLLPNARIIQCRRPSGRHLPVDLLYAFSADDIVQQRQAGARRRLPAIRPADGSLALGIAGGALSRCRLRRIGIGSRSRHPEADRLCRPRVER